MSPVVSLRGVAKAYRGISLFDDVNLDLHPGTATAILGPNGCGKSVLLRIMCRFTLPDSGEVTIDDEYLDGNKVFPAQFGVMIDRPGALGGVSGFENLRQLAKIRNRIDDGQIRNTMELLGLEPDLKTKVRHYSLGMRQKLALAQAVMEHQRMLVLDEPFNALDDDATEKVMGLLRQHVAGGGTLVFTSHDRELVEALAESVWRINGQKLIPA